MSRRSQAALEFLTTYAWAFLVILITLGALYYFGVFDFSKFLPQRCLFPSQFECIDYSFVGNPVNQVRLKLANDIGENIQVTGFTITNDAVNPLSCSSLVPALPVDWIRDTEKDFTFSGCQNGAFIVEERTDAKITMKYYSPATPSKPEHTVNGRI